MRATNCDDLSRIMMIAALDRVADGFLKRQGDTNLHNSDCPEPVGRQLAGPRCVAGTITLNGSSPECVWPDSTTIATVLSSSISDEKRTLGQTQHAVARPNPFPERSLHVDVFHRVPG